MLHYTFASLVSLSLPAAAQDPTAKPADPPAVAFVGATVYTMVPGESPISDGVVVVRAGRIAAVGPRATVTIPQGALVREVGGKVILPGLVDTHSHIAAGPAELGERSGPLQPQVSAIDTLDATHPSLQLAQAGGITTVNVMPGSGNLIGGQTAYLKLRDAPSIDELLLCMDRRKEICGGLKMANGTNPQGDPNNPRMSRMGAAAQVRQVFLEARKAANQGSAAPVRESRRKKAKDAAQKPARGREPDLAKDPLNEVMAGSRIAHFHTHRSDDIVTALSIGKEFGFVPVLHHVTEGWKQVDAIAAAQAPCSLIVVDSPGGKEEAMEIRLETAAILAKAGVKIAFHTDDPITDSRLLLRSAALAVRGGLDEQTALAAVTRTGAEILGLDSRVGSLSAGKDADLVVLSGPPLSIWTHVEETWVEGEKVFDRSDPKDRLYATGGFDRAREYPALGVSQAPPATPGGGGQ